MGTVTLNPAIFQSAAKESDGTTAVPFVNPDNGAHPRYQPGPFRFGTNPAAGFAGQIDEPTPTAAADRSVPGAPVTPAGGERDPDPGVEPEPEPVDATDATAGAPGVWLPEGSLAPQLMADAPLLTGDPTWTIGQYNLLRNGTTHIYWNGTAWASGNAP